MIWTIIQKSSAAKRFMQILFPGIFNISLNLTLHLDNLALLKETFV